MTMDESPLLSDFPNGLPDEAVSFKPGRKNTAWKIIIVLIIASFSLGIINLIQSGSLAILTGTGAVVGVVRDDVGKPIPAEVFVYQTQIATQANGDGQFILENIPPGEQVVIVTFRNIGREYVVNVIQHETVNIGELRFHPEDFLGGWSQSGLPTQ